MVEAAVCIFVLVLLCCSSNLKPMLGVILLVSVFAVFMGCAGAYQYGFYSVRYQLEAERFSLLYKGKEKVTFRVHQALYVTNAVVEIPTGGTSKRLVDLFLFSEKPIDTVFFSLVGDVAIRYALKNRIILLPVSDETAIWIAEYMGIENIPQYPKMAFISSATQH